MNTFTNIIILACPMCMSGAEGNTVLAANAAIGLLMTVLIGVLSAFFAFIIYLARRARRFAHEVPGEGDGRA